MYLCYFVIISLRKGRVPSFEQTWIPFTQECFEPRLIEISSVVLEKNLWKFCQCIFTISLLSPLGKGWGPSFEQTWIPFTHGCFVPSFVEIGPAILEKKMKMRKVYDNANNDDDKDWQRTNFDQKSSLAQVSLKGFKNTPKIRAVIITILRCYHTLNYKSKISDISLAHFHFFLLFWSGKFWDFAVSYLRQVAFSDQFIYLNLSVKLFIKPQLMNKVLSLVLTPITQKKLQMYIVHMQVVLCTICISHSPRLIVKLHWKYVFFYLK